MAEWDESFYKGMDEYSDGSIEDVIYESVRNTTFEDDLDEIIGHDYTMAYHLSPIRENILNWYPFQKTESAIEIGAGCGAITGLLCRRLENVVAIDLSKKRSLINYERHKKYNNLRIVVGNFNDVELGEYYDYVILNGVLEYALCFTDTSDPYCDFLRNIARFLKPEGKFLIAIENKLGLKYFNGAKEDHTGNYFLGLNGYEGNETVRTFTKTELTDLLKKADIPYVHFYYPYPDYKFPDEIFTKETMQPNQYGRPVVNIEDGRYVLFDENRVGEFLLKEHVREIFANSFLVEASKIDFASQIQYVKLNMDRRPEFRIGTVIEGSGDKKQVKKIPLTNEALSHIEHIAENKRTGKKNRIVNLSPQKKGKELIFPFLKQKNLDYEIGEFIEERNREAIIRVLTEFFCCYLQELGEQKNTSKYHTDLFREFFGEIRGNKSYLCVKSANIDMIMDNIYRTDGGYIVIDGEWVFPQWIPYEFVIWRSLNELYSKHDNLAYVLKRMDVLAHLEIDEKDEVLFRYWAEHFAQVYVGSRKRNAWSKKMTPISVDRLYQKEQQKKHSVMSLYFDYGDGFSEAEKLYRDVALQDGEFTVTFDLKSIEQIQGLRFDPVEGRLCHCILDSISEGFWVRGSNADVVYGGQDCFAHMDPQYYLTMVEKMPSLTIQGYIHFLSEDEVIEDYMKIGRMYIDRKYNL